MLRLACLPAMKTVPASSLSHLPEPGNHVRHYLPLSDEMFHCGFYVTSSGYSTISPGTPYPPVKHPTLYHFDWKEGRVLPEFSLMLITAGEGVFESEATGTVSLKPGLAAFLFPGIWHRYRPNMETGWTERWMQFQRRVCPSTPRSKNHLSRISGHRFKELEGD